MEYKTPAGVRDFQIDWATDLGADTITGTPTHVLETGIIKDSQTNTATTTSLVISGGTLGKRYKITSTIATAGGKTHEVVWFLTIQDKVVA